MAGTVYVCVCVIFFLFCVKQLLADLIEWWVGLANPPTPTHPSVKTFEHDALVLDGNIVLASHF